MPSRPSRAPLGRVWARLGIPADYAETRGLPVQREARTLVRIGRNDDGRILRLTPAAAAAWRRMQAAAARDGLTLVPVSAFRSVARQAQIIRQKRAGGQRLDAILRFIAAPGCSEHHTGRALDLGSPDDRALEASFGRTREFRWLRRHAGRFGFHLSYPKEHPSGIGYEPWHWCWRAATGRPRR